MMRDVYQIRALVVFIIMMTLQSKMHAYGNMLTIPLSPKKLRRGNLYDVHCNKKCSVFHLRLFNKIYKVGGIFKV